MGLNAESNVDIQNPDNTSILDRCKLITLENIGVKNEFYQTV